MNLIIIYFRSLQKYKKFCNRKLLKNAKVCVTDLLRTLTQWLSLTCGAMNYISIMNHTQESFATMTAEPLWSISGIIMHQIFPSIRKWTKTEHLWIFFFLTENRDFQKDSDSLLISMHKLKVAIMQCDWFVRKSSSCKSRTNYVSSHVLFFCSIKIHFNCTFYWLSDNCKAVFTRKKSILTRSYR